MKLVAVLNFDVQFMECSRSALVSTAIRLYNTFKPLAPAFNSVISYDAALSLHFMLCL